MPLREPIGFPKMFENEYSGRIGLVLICAVIIHRTVNYHKICCLFYALNFCLRFKCIYQQTKRRASIKYLILK